VGELRQDTFCEACCPATLSHILLKVYLPSANAVGADVVHRILTDLFSQHTINFRSRQIVGAAT
jgi:hypothetical protein